MRLHAPSASKRLVATVGYGDGVEAELKYVCCGPHLSVTAKPASEQRYDVEAAEGSTKYLVFDFIYMHLVGREAHQKPINK